MTAQRRSLPALLFAASALAACGARTDEAAQGACRAEAARGLAGMERVTDQQAMRMTGATLVRQIAPGQAVTMDFRAERVTIETDPATNRVIGAACG
jgi:hypothetical protein